MPRFNVLPLVLVATVGLLPVAPPEHVHEQDSADGHHHVIAHRHLQLHFSDRSTADHHHEGQDFDDEDAPILTFGAVFTAPIIQPPLMGPLPILTALILTPTCDCQSAPRDFVERLIHGPPRSPSGLRAPPPFLSA